jgi:prepilin-type N-terminal cleavage/methylation domain-containing protein
MRHQNGFTLIELAIVFVIIGVVATALVPSVMERVDAARLDASVQQAQKVLKIVELARKKIVSSSTATNLQVTHTYNNLTNWQTINVVQLMLGQNYNLPANNTFGLPLLVRFDDKRSYVAVDLPYLEPNYSWHPTVMVGGNTRIIISTKDAITADSSWVKHQKRMMHNEIAR